MSARRFPLPGRPPARWGRPCLSFLLFAVLLGAPTAGAAGEQGDLPVAGGPLNVYLLTIDVGDQVYEMFGHNALLIRNEETGEALAWNWGLFNFEDVDFIPRFLRGTMRYSMGPADPEWFLQGYAIANRAVYAHRVHLTQQEAAELDAFVRWNYLPENRPYIYDYYRDNCSTRVRDVLDLILGGVLQEQFAGESTGRSYRWFSRRQVQVTGWVDQGLSFLLGLHGDRPIDEWEAMFLPTELMASLEGVVIQPDGDAGVPYPLLGSREVWVPGDRQPLPASPPGPALALLALGLGGGVLVTAGGGRLSRGARDPMVWAMAGVALAWGLLAGGLGLLLAASWWTDHHFIHANMNLLQTNPVVIVPAVALALQGIRGSRPRGGSAGRIGAVVRWVALGVALLSVVGALSQISPLFRQGNGDVLFVAIPLNLAVALALWMGASGPQEKRS